MGQCLLEKVLEVVNLSGQYFLNCEFLEEGV